MGIKKRPVNFLKCLQAAYLVLNKKTLDVSLFKCNDVFAVIMHWWTLVVHARQTFLANGFSICVDGTFQWTRAVHRVEAHFCQHI